MTKLKAQRSFLGAATVVHAAGGTMTTTTSFATDIRPLFTERDIRAMIKAFDLASYDDVRTHSAAIFDRIRGIGGAVMPPPPPRGEGPWPQSRIELFAKGMGGGGQPETAPKRPGRVTCPLKRRILQTRQKLDEAVKTGIPSFIPKGGRT